MVTAFVLIQVARGKVDATAQALLEIDEVKEVYSIAGEHDLIAIVRTRAYEQMNEVVPGKIGAIPHITKTTTEMAFQCYSRHDLERLWSLGMDEELALKGKAAR